MVSWKRSTRQPTPSTPKPRPRHVPHVERVQLDDRGCDEILDTVAKFLEKPGNGALTIQRDRCGGRSVAYVRIGPASADQ